MLLRLPELKQEALAYESAPVCPSAQGEGKDCRSQVDAEVIEVKCGLPGSIRDQMSVPQSCVLELRVNNLRRFLDLPAERLTGRPALTRLRVEMFRGLPAAAMLDGQLVRSYGNPEQATHALRKMGWLWLGIWLVCSVYLWRRNRDLRRGVATSA